MGFQEKMEAYEAKLDGAVTEVIPSVSDAPIVTEPTTEVVANTEVTTPDTKVETTIPAVVEPDYNKFVEVSSDGLFKSVDDFKNALPKIKEYEALKTAKEQLEAKLNENPFANDFVKQYNDLIKQGRSEDQIESWVKLSKLGDLKTLDPFQIKVEKLVQDGFKRDVAERKINREFNLTVDLEDENLSEDEVRNLKLDLEDRKEELRISSVSDLQALEQLKGKITTPDNSAENRMLEEAALKKQYQETLKPIVSQIAQSYTGLGTFNLNGKEGAEAINFNIEVDAEYKAQVGAKLEDYFLDGTTPVNEKSVAEAKEYIDAVYLSQNFKTKIAPSIYNEGYSRGIQEMVNKYENKSGLPTSGLLPVSDDAAKSVREQQKRVASGLDD